MQNISNSPEASELQGFTIARCTMAGDGPSTPNLPEANGSRRPAVARHTTARGGGGE